MSKSRKQAIVGSQEEKDLMEIIPTAAKIYVSSHGKIHKTEAIRKAIEQKGILNPKLPEVESMTQYLKWMEEFHANNDTPKFATTKKCKETVIVHCYEDVYGVPLKGYEKKKDALQLKFSNSDLKKKASTTAICSQEDVMEQEAEEARKELEEPETDERAECNTDVNTVVAFRIVEVAERAFSALLSMINQGGQANE